MSPVDVSHLQCFQRCFHSHVYDVKCLLSRRDKNVYNNIFLSCCHLIKILKICLKKYFYVYQLTYTRHQ